MTQKITLRDVAKVFEQRLKAVPLKYYWREEKNSFAVETKGFEVTFQGLKPDQVKKAMEGLKLIEKQQYKERTYRWLLRWEHKSAQIQFRVTLYVYADGQQHFVFTTTW